MAAISNAHKRTVLLAVVAAGTLVAATIPASAHYYTTRCDRDGDDCYTVRCDDDGDDCVRVRHYYRGGYGSYYGRYGNYGYYGNGNGYNGNGYYGNGYYGYRYSNPYNGYYSHRRDDDDDDSY
jgi:hypothetical protein